jgi:hypothetical protein
VKLTAAAIGVALTVLTGCGSATRKPAPTVYIIDSGRTGWVKVLYNVHDEKELPVQNGFALAQLGQDLKLFTRSRMSPSWDGAQFYYQTPDGKRVRLSPADDPSRRIWAQDKTTDSEGERESFFVGSQEELSASLSTSRQIGSGLVKPTKDPEQPVTPGQPDGRDLLNALHK